MNLNFDYFAALVGWCVVATFAVCGVCLSIFTVVSLWTWL